MQLAPGAVRCSAATAGGTCRPIDRADRCRFRPGARGNGTIYARNKQLALGTTWVASPHFPARIPLRLVDDAGRQESAGARFDQRVRRVRHPRAADRSPDCRRTAHPVDHRLLGPRTPGHQSAVAVPDGLQSQGELHVAGRRALDEERATSSSGSTRKCRTSTRSTAATPTTARSRSRRRRSRTTTSTTSRDFMLGLRAKYAVEQRAGRGASPEHALRVSAGRLAAR